VLFFSFLAISSVLQVNCFCIPPLKQNPKTQPQIFHNIVSQVKNSVTVAIVCGVSLTFTFPFAPHAANALVSPPVREALVEASDATYPILKSLKPEYIDPVFNGIVKLLVKTVPSDKFGKFLDKSADVIISIPDNDLASFTSALKDAYGDQSPTSCDLVPLPVDAANKFAMSEALTKVDPNKLKILNEKLDATIKAIPKQETKMDDGDTSRTTVTAICLPSEKDLEKVFVAQTELSLTVNQAVLQDFGNAATVVGKSIPPSDLIRLLPEFQKTQRGVDAKAKKRFENAGKAVDKAIKRDYAFARLSGKV